MAGSNRAGREMGYRGTGQISKHVEDNGSQVSHGWTVLCLSYKYREEEG